MVDPQASVTERRAHLNRIAIARQHLLDAVQQERPATTYDLCDLVELAAGTYNTAGALTFRELELAHLRFESFPPAASAITGLQPDQLAVMTALYGQLQRFFSRFRKPPYWFKKAILHSLMLAHHAEHRWAEIPLMVREVDPMPRAWYYVEPDGERSDREYIDYAVERFRLELQAVLAQSDGVARAPLMRDFDNPGQPLDIAFEWAARWITGSDRDELRWRYRHELDERPGLPEEVQNLLDFIGWPTSEN